jgi:hypothetical protein
MPTVEPPWREVSAAQSGVIARRQLLQLGFTAATARRYVRSGRWQLISTGIHATFTGPAPVITRLWAAVLHAGTGAALTGRAALWLEGALDDPPRIVEVCVTHERRCRARAGMVVTARRHLADLIHPTRLPPRLRIEDAALDLARATDDVRTVVDVVLRATQRRLTTPERLAARLAARPRHRWRTVIAAILTDAEAGVQSGLEHRCLHQVERVHGLPKGVRNAPERDGVTGSKLYRDVRYAQWGVVVELDGRQAHPVERAFKDRARDSTAAAQGLVPLRYTWREVVGDACGVAGEVADVLRSRGWSGTARPCRPRCTTSSR